MSETMSNHNKRKGYGPFALAAALYTLGVISFSTWSYFQQRTNLLAQVDQSLINATHATEQILGSIFIACAVETKTIYELGYASNREKLNRFSRDCRFDAIGALGYKGTETWPLISGGESTGIISSTNSHIPELLQPKISAIVLELANSKSEHVRLQTVQTKEYGELRLAIRYHTISSDTGYALMVARNTRNVNQLIRALARRTVTTGVFLYAMAFPLIFLYNRTHTKTAQEMANLNTRLQQDVIKQKEREVELEDAVRDLERFNALAVGRENRIIELKAEVNTLLEQMKREKRYNVE